MKLLFILFFATNVFATTFKPLEVEIQLAEADGVFLGHYLRKKTIELEDGSLATQMIFKMNKEYGLQSNLLRQEEIIVHYPGGKTAEKKVLVEGVPKFIQGEKVLVFTKSINNRNWGLNLGLGAYQVINYGRKTLMINHLFPHHPVIGQISLDKFEENLRDIKRASFKEVTYNQEISEGGNSRLPASTNMDKPQRSPASFNKEDDSHIPTSGNVWAFLILLGLFGGLIRQQRQKSLPRSK